MVRRAAPFSGKINYHLMKQQFKHILAASLMVSTLVPAQGAELAALRKGADALVPPEPATVLCGIMVSNDTWTSTDDAGVYTIEVKSDGAIKCLHK